ncbi:MAG: zinc-ribbon domain-containing protein [Anaerolineae bacterium]|nr:zinc-ribbon domain-containing protein [Anaerolineae bacterium]
MTTEIEFVSNYRDLSTERGFQFEFTCNRCGTGYRTPFKASALGTATSVLDAANSLLGGIFSSAANISERVRSAAWQKAHDEAFAAASAEIKPSFVQCPRCSSWVCRKSCWNTKRGLCKDCAPDLGVEMSAAQASRSVEEVWAHAAMAEEDKKLGKEQWRETIRATCPNCEAPLATNAKFCPECGTKLKTADKCAKCGAKLTPGAKFCPECGEKVA